jgi:hypothetical protein
MSNVLGITTPRAAVYSAPRPAGRCAIQWNKSCGRRVMTVVTDNDGARPSGMGCAFDGFS